MINDPMQRRDKESFIRKHVRVSAARMLKSPLKADKLECQVALSFLSVMMGRVLGLWVNETLAKAWGIRASPQQSFTSGHDMVGMVDTSITVSSWRKGRC
jgi:hypothetical protein